VEPVVFPPMLVPIDQLVSNPILEQIRGCHGLIYLDSPASNESFWVTMERDYAARQDKPVYRFDFKQRRLHRWMGRTLTPAIWTASVHNDTDFVREVVKLMEQRFFHVETDVRLPSTRINPDELLKQGGYFVLFWSSQAADSWHIRAELSMVLEFPGQIVVVRIDETPFPKLLQNKLRDATVVDLTTNFRQSRLHTIDDLIVRLYWLVASNSGLASGSG
jgi:hypothetical protein